VSNPRPDFVLKEDPPQKPFDASCLIPRQGEDKDVVANCVLIDEIQLSVLHVKTYGGEQIDALDEPRGTEEGCSEKSSTPPTDENEDNFRPFWTHQSLGTEEGCSDKSSASPTDENTAQPWKHIGISSSKTIFGSSSNTSFERTAGTAAGSQTAPPIGVEPMNHLATWT